MANSRSRSRSRSRSKPKSKAKSRGGKGRSRATRQSSSERDLRKGKSPQQKNIGDPGVPGVDDDDEPESPPVRLPDPIVSPRDPGHYRVIKLRNGFKAVLISTLGYAAEEAARNIANRAPDPCDTKSDTNVFNRTKKSTCKEAAASRTATARRKPENGCFDKKVDHFDREMNLVVRMSNQVRKSILRQEMEAYEQEQDIAEPMDEDEVVHDGSQTSTDSSSATAQEDDDDAANVFDSTGEEAATAVPDPRPSTSKDPDKGKDTPPEERLTHKWGPEPESQNKILLAEEKVVMNKRVQGKTEMAITFATGSMFDDTEVRGLSHLAREALVHAMREKEIFSEETQFIPAEYTTIHVSTHTANLKQHCESIVTHINDLKPGRQHTLEDIDKLDRHQEILQCAGCWGDPRLDERRLAVLLSLAKDKHPVRQISVGDTPALWGAWEASSTELERHIVAFINDHYIGPNGTVAVSGPDTLDALEDAISPFSLLADTGKPTIKADSEPFDNKKFRMYNIFCSNPHCSDLGDAYLTIAWGLSPTWWQNYETKPLDFLGSLMSDSGYGGLKHYLKENNLAWDFKAGCDAKYKGVHRNQFCSVFEVELSLSEDGLKKVDEVIGIVFSFLKFVRNSGVPRAYYKDLQKMGSVEFHALDREVNEMDQFPVTVPNLSVGLHLHSSRDLLISPMILRKFDEVLIQDCADLLVPETANIMLCVCPKDATIQAQGEKMEVEPIFKTNYIGEEISPERLKAWTDASASHFSHPPPNPFIHVDMCRVAPGEPNVFKLYQPDPASQLQEFYRIWHHQDLIEDHYAIYYIHVISPAASACLQNASMLILWFLMINDALEPILGAAIQAGINYSIKPTPSGLLVAVSSWNSKLPDVVEIILREIGKFGSDVTLEKFKKWKKAWLKHTAALMRDEYASNPFVAKELYDSVILANGWSAAEKYEQVACTTTKTFQSFMDDFKKKFSVATLLHGNVNSSSAAAFATMMEAVIPPNYAIKHFQIRQNILHKRDRIFRFASLSPDSVENYVYNAYQIGNTCVLSRVMSDFIIAAMIEHMKKAQMPTSKPTSKRDDELKSKPADSHIFPSLIEYQGNVTLVLESYGFAKNHSLNDLDKRADKFLADFYHHTLLRMNEADFKRIKRQVHLQYKTAQAQSWDGTKAYDLKMHGLYIVMEDLTFRFDEPVCKMIALKSMTHADVKDHFKSRLSPDDQCEFRKASVQVYGRNMVDLTGTNPPPKTRAEWRHRRKTLRECTFNEHHTLAHAHRPLKKENFEIKLIPEKPGKCTNEHFITDIPGFKRTLYGIPTRICLD